MRDVILGGSGAPERPAAGSTVPEFRAVRLTEGWAVVTCPRKSCGGMFEVNRALWESSNLVKVRTRPCPYCFRVGWLPGEKPGAEQPEPGKCSECGVKASEPCPIGLALATGFPGAVPDCPRDPVLPVEQPKRRSRIVKLKKTGR